MVRRPSPGRQTPGPEAGLTPPGCPVVRVVRVIRLSGLSGLSGRCRHPVYSAVATVSGPKGSTHTVPLPRRTLRASTTASATASVTSATGRRNGRRAPRRRTGRRSGATPAPGAARGREPVPASGPVRRVTRGRRNRQARWPRPAAGRTACPAGVPSAHSAAITIVPPGRTTTLGRRHPLHRLVQVAVERISPVRAEDDVEGRSDRLHRGALDETARGGVPVG